MLDQEKILWCETATETLASITSLWWFVEIGATVGCLRLTGNESHILFF